MTTRKIDQLIARRNKLTNRRDGLYDHKVVDDIDKKLAALSPAGERNDVDLLLGRTCATLPSQPVYDAHSHAETVAKRHGDMTGIGWPLQAMINTVNDAKPLSDLSERMALAYKESELKDYDDWQHIKGDCDL